MYYLLPPVEPPLLLPPPPLYPPPELLRLLPELKLEDERDGAELLLLYPDWLPDDMVLLPLEGDVLPL